MKIYLDVNVVLDYVLGRAAYGMEAAQVITLARRLKMNIVTAPNTFVIAYFHIHKITRDPVSIKHSLALTRKLIDCVSIDGMVIDQALKRNQPVDLEDSVQVEAALASNAELLLTNDRQMLTVKDIRVMTTRRFLDEYAVV